MNIKVERIETERLVLRQMEIPDLDDYFRWRSNSKYHQFLSSKALKNLEDYAPVVIDCVESYKTDRPNLFWVVELKDNREVIGGLSIDRVVDKYKSIEIGWGLNLDYQGKGYAFESVKAFVDYLFNTYDINRIQISIWEGNIKSKKLADKLGFVYEGLGRESRFKDGKFFNNWNFGLLKKEWKKKK